MYVNNFLILIFLRYIHNEKKKMKRGIKDKEIKSFAFSSDTSNDQKQMAWSRSKYHLGNRNVVHLTEK